MVSRQQELALSLDQKRVLKDGFANFSENYFQKNNAINGTINTIEKQSIPEQFGMSLETEQQDSYIQSRSRKDHVRMKLLDKCQYLSKCALTPPLTKQ